MFMRNCEIDEGELVTINFLRKIFAVAELADLELQRQLKYQYRCLEIMNRQQAVYLCQ